MEYLEWRKHIARRTDFTSRVTHLTRRTDERTAFENLIKILDEKKLIGSTTAFGFIVGDRSAVCFQDVPLLSIAENLSYEQEWVDRGGKVRYEAYGLRFNKAQLFQKGGRPVFYDKTQTLKDMLPEEEYWRIVNLDISDGRNVIDWTHEREWRVPGDLSFEYSEIQIIVKSISDYKKLISYCLESNVDVLRNVNGIICLESLLN